MMRIKKERQHVQDTFYIRRFQWEDGRGAGFGFPCDSEGQIHEPKCEETRKNHQLCMRGQDDSGRRLVDKGVQVYYGRHTEPAVGVCNVCGGDVELPNALLNPCETCGSLYNGLGQHLDSREELGRETEEAETGD